MLKILSAPLCALLLITGAGVFQSASAATPVPPPPPPPGNQIVDEKASGETAALFNYLRKTSGKGMLFGHQHETTQGLTITNQASLNQSDTKSAVGDYAAVYGWDSLSIIGSKPEGDVVDHIKAAYRRGGIITISAHLDNPKTGGTAWDKTPGVENALPGGEKNAVYNAYLDELADWALALKDDNGKPIPVLFRALHENTAGWFWWGSDQSTPSQYINLYRYTVEYLRDKRSVHNFLYVYSPADKFSIINEASFLERYPGDAYVDVLAFDAYGAAENNADYMSSVVKYAALVSRMAQARGKVSAMAEVGVMEQDIVAGKEDPHWYTKLLN
ncbi:MAG: beta-mannosidase, partial [Chitinophagaceae bacterium]